MTRKVHDQFSKRLLNRLLSPGGTVQTSYTLSSEIKEIDLLQLMMKTRTKKLSKDEQELVENLNPIYEVWERETINRGIEQGIERGIERGREEGLEIGRQQMLSRTVPLLLQAGLSIDQIATQLQVKVETVRQAMQPSQGQT